MKMERRAQLLALWIGLLAAALALVHSSPAGIFMPVPRYGLYSLGAFLLVLGFWGYQENRLTTPKIVTVALVILFVFSVPTFVFGPVLTR